MYEHVYKVFALKDTDSILAAHESRQVAYWVVMSVGLKNNVGGLWVSILNWIENININLDKTELSFYKRGTVYQLTCF